MTDIKTIPPQNLEAEKAILGGIILDNRAMDTVHTLISVDDFYREAHRKIFRGMCELTDKNEPVDFVTLTTMLKSNGTLDDVGGGAYLALLFDDVHTSANIAYYCRAVADKATERRLLESTLTATQLVRNGEMDQAVQALETAINQTTNKRTDTIKSVKDVVRESIKGIERRFETGGEIGMPTGITELDTVTGGLHRGDLVIIAGRPSMGKTTLALNLLESTCNNGMTGMLFSLEMSRQQNIDKMLSSRGNIDYGRIRFGTLQGAEWDRLTRASSALYGWNFWIDDTPGISLREIRAKARRQKKNGLDLLVVDYLQLMRLQGKESRNQELGNVSRELKTLARELDMCVVALSQLNRSVDGRQDKRPTMSDLRDSGELEQDADVIIFPYREAAYCAKCKDRIEDADHRYIEHQAEAEIILEKQRNGERNLSIPAVWIGKHQKFANVDKG